jgi:ABC-type sugar transport system ATPase subunit
MTGSRHVRTSDPQPFAGRGGGDRIVVLNRGRKYAGVPTAETKADQIVGWITGARPSMFAA